MNMNWTLAIVALLLIIFFVGRWYSNRDITKYSVDETQAKLAAGEAVLLDVRTSGERAEKAIKNSLHIPLDQLEGRLTELEKHRSKEIIAYCRSGSRSLAAADLLGKNGFTAASMNGGIMGWQEPEKRTRE